MTKLVNYAKMDSDRIRHHERYKRYVAAMPRKLVCQDCRGYGGHVEPILDDGTGPYYECGWCEGTGYVTPHRRGLWLRCRVAA